MNTTNQTKEPANDALQVVKEARIKVEAMPGSKTDLRTILDCLRKAEREAIANLDCNRIDYRQSSVCPSR